jgi:hypothetical protein
LHSLYDNDLASFDSLLKEAQRLRQDGNIVSLEIQNKKNTKKQLDNLTEQGFTAFGIYQPNDATQFKRLASKNIISAMIDYSEINKS